MRNVHCLDIASVAPDKCFEHRTVASYERELERNRRAELQLREIIALDDPKCRRPQKHRPSSRQGTGNSCFIVTNLQDLCQTCSIQS